MTDEINNLHRQIKNLMDEAVGPEQETLGAGDVRRMSAAERRLLSKARMACGPLNGSDWRKAGI